MTPTADSQTAVDSTRLVGGHVDAHDPIVQAKEIGASVVQMFLGDGQSWKGPVVDYDGGEEALAQAIADSGIEVYIHAPYVINVASLNNRIRIPSRKLLQSHVNAAARLGAKGVIVHGGHVTKDDDPAKGFDNWRKAFDQIDLACPVLIENTAGGQFAMARRLEAIDQLWSAIDNSEAGFCLDTCHAWAGGIELPDAAEEILKITGRIDLVHANDSQGDFDSGRDRHANFGEGTTDTDELIETIRRAGAPVVCETPTVGIASDIALLNEKL